MSQTAAQMLLPAKFYDSIRPALYPKGMPELAVTGIENIYAGCAGLVSEDIAYILATVYREAGSNMQPVREIGQGIGKAYGTKYYGRGLVQITWEYNYVRFDQLLGIDLVGNPDLALDWKYAVPILVKGMTQGLFTGKKLSDYFTTKTSDPVNARRIVNGTNDATMIAGYFKTFLVALT